MTRFNRFWFGVVIGIFFTFAQLVMAASFAHWPWGKILLGFGVLASLLMLVQEES